MTKKRKLKKSVKIVLGIVGILVILLIALFLLLRKPKEETAVEVTPTPTTTSTPTPTPTPHPYLLSEEKIQELHKEYEEDKQINDEIVGVLYFNSGIIHQPVVYDPTNNKYLRTDWRTMNYDPVGTAFMDFRNDLSADDQNTIIYGHYVYESYSSDRTLMFTPLELFRDEKNYEENKYLVFVGEDEIRYYEVAVAFDCPLITIDGLQYTLDDLQYNLIDYDSDYFTTYKNTLKEYAFYDTGIDLEQDDYLLTLQTCVEGQTDHRLVIIAREIKREKI